MKGFKVVQMKVHDMFFSKGRYLTKWKNIKCVSIKIFE